MTEKLQSVDTQHKNSDSQKTAFTVDLMLHHKDAVSIYQDFGLMVKIPIDDEITAKKDIAWGHSVKTTKIGWERRKHFAPEHMVTVIAGTQALGQLLMECGILTNKTEVFEIEKAAAIHDAGKELEFSLVNAALKEPIVLGEYKNILNSPNIKIGNKEAFYAKIAEFSPKMDSKTSKGIRAQAAYDLAGEINELRLKEKNISPDLLKMQKMVGHASCPEVEKMVDSFNKLDSEKKRQAIQIFVIHYLDDIVTNPNIIDPAITESVDGKKLNALDRRCIQNENNSKYQEYNLDWKLDPRNKTGETAFAMQRRVGHKVEKLLAGILGLEDPLLLPSLIDNKIKDNIKITRSLVKGSCPKD